MSQTAPVPFPGAYWVRPRLLAGPHPIVWDARASGERLAALLDAGVTLIVDLTEADERPAYELALSGLAAQCGQRVRHARYAIPDLHTPPPAQMTAILDAIDAALAAGETVYVHCLGGIGRTGTVVGCHLVRQGAPGDAALATICALRGGLLDSPETEDQRRMVRSWRE